MAFGESYRRWGCAYGRRSLKFASILQVGTEKSKVRIMAKQKQVVEKKTGKNQSRTSVIVADPASKTVDQLKLPNSYVVTSPSNEAHIALISNRRPSNIQLLQRHALITNLGVVCGNKYVLRMFSGPGNDVIQRRRVTGEEREDLVRIYGEDVVDRWNEEFANYSANSDNRLLRLHGIFFTLKDYIGDALAAYEAIDALINTSPSDSAYESMQKFKTVFDAIKELIPYVPGFAEFLSYYSVAIEGVSRKLNQIFTAIKAREEGIVVLHPGVWPGGWPLYRYMVRLMTAEEPLDVPDPVISWVKDNHDLLKWVTDETPPAKREALLGIDLLWPDKLDRNGLKRWFFNHRNEVKLAIYGQASFLE